MLLFTNSAFADQNTAATIAIPVLAHPLPANSLIRQEDLIIIDMPKSHVGRRVIVDISKIIGFASRRDLRTNDPVTLQDIIEPILVNKGDLVTVLIKTDGLELSTSGKAMDNGSMGTIIRILNLNSNRVISAVVNGENMAIIANFQ